jgi:hypothetical protein
VVSKSSKFTRLVELFYLRYLCSRESAPKNACGHALGVGECSWVEEQVVDPSALFITLDPDLGQSDREHQLVGCKETLTEALVEVDEHCLGHHFEALVVLALWQCLELLCLRKHAHKDIHVLLERVLVQVVNTTQRLEREEDAAGH